MIIDLHRDCSKDISSSNGPALSTGHFIRDFVGLILFCLSAHRDFTQAYLVGYSPAGSPDSNNPQQTWCKTAHLPSSATWNGFKLRRLLQVGHTALTAGAVAARHEQVRLGQLCNCLCGGQRGSKARAMAAAPQSPKKSHRRAAPGPTTPTRHE